MVVFIHSQSMEYFTEVTGHGAYFVEFESFFVEYICCWAVPGFFMCSGFLFYRNFTMDKLLEKFKSRFFSLVVPFIVWNGIYYFVNYIMRKLPYIKELFDAPMNFNIFELLESLVMYKWNPVFWFVGYLIIYTYLCPVIYSFLLNKWCGFAMVIAIFFASFFNVGGSLLYWFLFYFLGAYLGIHAKDIIESNKYNKQIFFLSIIGLLITILTDTITTDGEIFYKLFGVMTIWYLLSLLSLPKSHKFMGYTFFIYAIHPMAAQFINKMSSIVLGVSMNRGIIVFFCIPVVIFVLCSIIGNILSKNIPFLWKILSGGR